MQRLTKTIIAAALAAACLPTVASAEVTNWVREYIKMRQAAQIARVFGDQAALDYLNAPAPRIVGGNTAPAGKWPAQVGLLQKSVADNFNAQFCGGTLVNKRFVLTAAHCSDIPALPATKVQVLTGTQSLASGGTRRNVAKITVHPKWNPDTFDYDIAVWKLSANVNGITPAPMLKKTQEANLADPGTKTFVTGWGALSEGGSFPTALQQVSVPIIKTSVCNGTDSYNGDITGRMICAGVLAGGKDSCQGDSGGPLWVKNGQGQFKIVAGVVSWGIGCARPDLPGVYTRLAILSAWVQQIINQQSDVADEVAETSN